MPTTTIDKGQSFSDSVGYGTGNGTDAAAQSSINLLPATAPEGMVAGFAKGKRARVISTNLAGRDNRNFVRQFNKNARRRSDIKEPVLKVTINLKPGERLRAFELVEMVGDYRHQMGLANCPYLAIEHREKAHQHLHIIFSRVDFDGKLVGNKFDRLEARKWARLTETKYSLTPTSERTKRRGMTSGETEKYERTGELPQHVRLQNHIDDALHSSAAEFVERLEEKNINVMFRFEKEKAVGVSFLFEGKQCAGGKLGTDFTWGTLQSRGVDYEPERDDEKLRAVGARSARKSDQKGDKQSSTDRQIKQTKNDASAAVETEREIESSIKTNHPEATAELPDTPVPKSVKKNSKNVSELISETHSHLPRIGPITMQKNEEILAAEPSSKKLSPILQAVVSPPDDNEDVSDIESNFNLPENENFETASGDEFRDTKIPSVGLQNRITVNRGSNLKEPTEESVNSRKQYGVNPDANENSITQPLANYWWEIKAISNENKVYLNSSAYILAQQMWTKIETGKDAKETKAMPPSIPTEAAQNLVRQFDNFARENPDFEKIIKRVGNEIEKAALYGSDSDAVYFLSDKPKEFSEEQIFVSDSKTIKDSISSVKIIAPEAENLAGLLAEKVKIRHEIREFEYELKEWQKDKEFHRVEIVRGADKIKTEISLAELDKEARKLAKFAVNQTDKTGMLRVKALEESRPIGQIKRELFAANYETELEKQKGEREQIESVLSDRANKKQLVIAAKEAKWIDISKQVEAGRALMGEDAKYLNPNLKPEEIWRLQEKAGFRLDEAGFFELEALHRENRIPRSQEALGRLRGAGLMADITARVEKQTYDKFAGDSQEPDETIKVRLKSKDGVIEVVEMSRKEVEENAEDSKTKANELFSQSKDAGRQAVKSLLHPIETKINPLSPVQGSLSWFTQPKETLNNHVNPLQIIKNDPGVQVIRAVMNYAKYTKQAFDLDKLAKEELAKTESFSRAKEMADAAKTAANAAKPSVGEQLSELGKSRLETIENAERVSQRVKDALRWESEIRAREVALDGEIAKNLEVPLKNMPTKDWLKFGEKAIELNDAELLKEFQAEMMKDGALARGVGETEARIVARSVKADVQLAETAKNAISSIQKIGEGEIEIEVKLSNLAKFGEAEEVAEVAESLVEDLAIANVAPAFSMQEEVLLRQTMPELDIMTANTLNRLVNNPQSVAGNMQNLSEAMQIQPPPLIEFDKLSPANQQAFIEGQKLQNALIDMQNSMNLQTALEVQTMMTPPVANEALGALSTPPPVGYTVSEPVMQMSQVEKQTMQIAADAIAQGKLNDAYTEADLKAQAEFETEKFASDEADESGLFDRFRPGI